MIDLILRHDTLPTMQDIMIHIWDRLKARGLLNPGEESPLDVARNMIETSILDTIQKGLS